MAFILFFTQVYSILLSLLVAKFPLNAVLLSLLTIYVSRE